MEAMFDGTKVRTEHDLHLRYLVDKARRFATEDGNPNAYAQSVARSKRVAARYVRMERKHAARGRRGYRWCEKCGGDTRPVLDGEAWCDECGRYQ